MCPPVLSVVVAVVMSADLTHIGDQVGLALMSNAARPATCGEDIDVPEMTSKSWPRVPGAYAATMSTPGAVMSGLSRSPLPAIAGPVDEKPAICGARTGRSSTSEIEAVAPGVPVA